MNGNEQRYRWIADNIDTSGIEPKLPHYIREMIAEIEQADRENNLAVFDTVCNDLEVHTKLLLPDILNDHEWDTRNLQSSWRQVFPLRRIRILWKLKAY